MQDILQPSFSSEQISQIQQLAQQGDPQGIYSLANLYLHGISLEQDRTKALELFTLSAGLKHIPSIIALGYFYYDSQYPTFSLEKARSYFKQAADMGSGEAWSMLGSTYLDQSDSDYLLAKEYFEKAIKANEYSAYCKLGEMYYTGKLGSSHIKDAEPLFNKALPYKIPSAFYYLGKIHLSRDNAAASQYMQTSMLWHQGAMLGSVECMDGVAQLLCTGVWDKEYTLKAALYWIFAALETGQSTISDLPQVLEQARSAGSASSAGASGAGAGTAAGDAGTAGGAAGADDPNTAAVLAAANKVQTAPQKDLALYFQQALALSLPHGYSVESLVNMLQTPSDLYDFAVETLKSKGPQHDHALAVLCFKAGAMQGHALSQAALGLSYNVSDSLTYQPQQAIYWLEQASAQNEPQAMTALATIYMQNDTKEAANVERALQLWQAAADLGNTQALCALGNCYLQGLGVEADPQKAIELFSKAQGEGAMCLGEMYLKGKEVDQNYELAKQYYEQALKENMHAACRYLGHLYENGLGVKQDRKKAASLYQQGYEHDDANSGMALADLYFEGIEPGKPDYTKAREIYNNFIFTKNPEILSRLGWMLMFGKGGEEKPQVGLKLIAMAADLDHPFALYNLGLSLCRGKIIPQNIEKGVVILTRAAQLGFQPAKDALHEINNMLKPQ